MKRSPLAAPTLFLLHFVVVATGVGLNVGCGARSELRLWGEDGATGDTAGEGGHAGECATLGEGCAGYTDCCNASCVDGICTTPASACVGDEQPTLLMSGLADPFAMGGDAVSLVVGELAMDQPLLRIPKAGGPAVVLLASVNSVDFLVVRERAVYFSENAAVSSVPTKGGVKSVLASASRPAGLAVTPRHVYFADYGAEQLVQIDRVTLDAKVLGNQPLPGIYRVAEAEDLGLIYFSDATNGVSRYDFYDSLFDTVGIGTPPSRAVRIFGEQVYFAVPTITQVFRLGVSNVDNTLLADLSPLGVYLEALESDGTFLYLTLETGKGNGLIVRVPMEGGEVEIVADAQGPRPSALVVDDHCVYWTERETGSVYRARKDPHP